MFSRVFVYGTLKRGEPNHQWITDPKNGIAKYLGNACTVQKFPLVIASRYNIPFLLDAPGQGKNINGELYEVDEAKLSHLDILEDYPKLYTRRFEDVLLHTSDGKSESVQTWLYLLQKFKDDMLKLPHLDNYHSEGEHGLKYVERYLREDGSIVGSLVKNIYNDDLSDPEEI